MIFIAMIEPASTWSSHWVPYMLSFPLSATKWDNMADHVVDNYEAIGLPFQDDLAKLRKDPALC